MENAITENAYVNEDMVEKTADIFYHAKAIAQIMGNVFLENAIAKKDGRDWPVLKLPPVQIIVQEEETACMEIAIVFLDTKELDVSLKLTVQIHARNMENVNGENVSVTLDMKVLIVQSLFLVLEIVQVMELVWTENVIVKKTT